MKRATILLPGVRTDADKVNGWMVPLRAYLLDRGCEDVWIYPLGDVGLLGAAFDRTRHVEDFQAWAANLMQNVGPYDEMDIVAHSLGSLIAFEATRLKSAQPVAFYRRVCFMGSPISSTEVFDARADHFKDLRNHFSLGDSVIRWSRLAPGLGTAGWRGLVYADGLHVSNFDLTEAGFHHRSYTTAPAAGETNLAWDDVAAFLTSPDGPQEGTMGCTHERLMRIETKLDRLLQRETTMAAKFQDLIVQIQKNADTEDSALQAINGLLARIQAVIDAGGTPEQVQAEIDLAKKSADALAAAVATIPTP